MALGHLGTDALGAAVAELRSAEGSTAVGVKALACRALGEAGHEAAAAWPMTWVGRLKATEGGRCGARGT